MRNLTIQRVKSFVASLATMKVYIEDHEAGELTIDGCPCRKLGILKNGETATFQIPENAAKVYVIGDKLSRKFSNEFYPLPAGQEDIVLSGKCQYNPAAGNPFRFDGVTDEAVLKNRKKGSRIGAVVLVIAAIVGLALGFWLNMPKDKTFSVGGMEISLTNKFEEEEDADGFDAAYSTNDVLVLILKERFSLLPGSEDFTLEEYGEIVIETSNRNATLSTENGVTYFEYQTKGSDGDTYHYIITMHKGPNAFWLVEFCTLEEDLDEYRDDIFEWAASVTFED